MYNIGDEVYYIEYDSFDRCYDDPELPARIIKGAITQIIISSEPTKYVLKTNVHSSISPTKIFRTRRAAINRAFEEYIHYIESTIAREG